MPNTASTSLSRLARLETNLAALGARSPWAAAAVRAVESLTESEIQWFATPSGAMTARFQGRLLASARDPLDEARELVSSLDLTSAGLFAVMGLGAGHHVDALAKRLGRHGAIFVYEPNVRLLRSVLEHVELAPVLLSTSTFIFTDPADTVPLATASRGIEGLMALGVGLVDHLPSRGRLGESAGRFGQQLTSIVRSVKTTVLTTLLNSEVTLRNELMNIEPYAAQYRWSRGVGDLEGRYRGKPAVVVSAGPSLRRNVELLARPELRQRVVVIAVQTVLKTLLARGIRPDFVTALDYHEISRRFYEGLSASDVAGITLVCEAKASPAILDAWPKGPESPVLCPASATLDAVLGRATDPASQLKPGATVAHLAYYLARHMGCDPVVLIGQDLGFTDGQYYAAGAAIHNIWASELNPFRSLEMMEWERIVRHKGILHRVEGHDGRSMFTDEQMNTYRLQFERDFAADAAQGLTTIDATEGGVRKAHTTLQTLSEALEGFRPSALPPAMRVPRAEPSVESVRSSLDAVRVSTLQVAHHSRRAADLLTEMLRHHADQSRVTRLIGEVNAVRDQVRKLEPAFGLVRLLNQTGTLKRVRADRAMALTEGLDDLQQQRRQIERDLDNVRWLGDAADSLAATMQTAIAALDGGPKPTADAAVEGQAEDGPALRRAVIAVAVVIDRARLADHAAMDRPLLAGRTPLQLLLARLGRCREVDRVVVLSDAPEAVAALVSTTGALARNVQVVPATEPLGLRRGAILAGRSPARECWRGGVGNLSIYDEALEPAAMAALCDQLALDGIVPIDPSWCLVDPGMIDAVVTRHRAHSRQCTSDSHKITFAQAAPGLGACVLSRMLLKELAAHEPTAGVFASIGGMLGYIPVAPQPDPIAKAHAHTPDPIVRDLAVRVTADSAASRALLERSLAPLGASIVEASAEQIAELLSSTAPPISDITLELNTGRLTSGLRGQWLRGRSSDTIERPPISLQLAGSILQQIGELQARGQIDATLTLYGAGDPILHAELPRIVALARRQGVRCVHVRTDLLGEERHIDALLDAAADIVSVDLNAETAETYRQVMGASGYERAREHLERVLSHRAAVSGSRLRLATPLVVPRITRCDATLCEIEAFYDRWLLSAGAAAIDPVPVAAATDRIQPLPVPDRAARRGARRALTILCDGSVVGPGEWAGERPLADLRHAPLEATLRRAPEFERRRQGPKREAVAAP